MSPEEVKDAFLFACRTEVAALKPGNVHIYASGHRMTVADFEMSAAAAAPYIAAPNLSTGAAIQAGMRATRDAVHQNTNLGILLLTAPLARAALVQPAGSSHPYTANSHASLPRMSCTSALNMLVRLVRRKSCESKPHLGQDFLRGVLAGTQPQELRNSLRHVLDQLTIADADGAFAGIALANPGGLGDAPEQDVRQPPAVTLLEAMRLASQRDRIAHQYATAFEDIFETGLPAIKEGVAWSGDARWAAVYAYLTLLAEFPDTHIVRKFGAETAEQVRLQAIPYLDAIKNRPPPDALIAPLLAFDSALKHRGINPGTSADLTAASLFAWCLCSAANTRFEAAP
jgi:triphosphoribosyl-dephospho-CoA synthase